MTDAAKRSPAKSFSASAICRRMDKQDSAIAAVQRTVGSVETQMGSFAQALQATQKQMQDDAKAWTGRHAELMALMQGIKDTIGEEKEDGQGGLVGTGIVGRMRRAEKSIKDMLLQYKIWIAFGSGFMFSAAGLVAALWWLVGDKLAIVLKGH